jgi:signal transduction histidine kinase/response regulator RpfG family c-di-GMP phosphodiesterase
MQTIQQVIEIEYTAIYLAIIGILSVYILFDLLRSKRLINWWVCKPLCFSVAAFLLGRAVMLVDRDPVLGGRLVPDSIWGLLNLASLLLAAEAIRRLLIEPFTVGDTTPASGDKVHKGLARLSILLQTSYFFGAGGLVCLGMMRVSGASFTAVGVLNVAIFASAIRPVAYLFSKIQRADSEWKQGFFLALTLVVLSWMAIFAALIIPDKAEALRPLGMFVDIIMLFSILMILLSAKTRIGLNYLRESELSRKQMEKTKEELAKLSKFASEIYEDNNALIKRQKEQTRTLSKRVDILEEILRVGIDAQEQKNLDELLQTIVESVRDNLGFKTVIIRLLNNKTQSFEAHAHIGLSEEARDTVLSYRLPYSEFEKMVGPKNRLSNSYFIKRGAQDENDKDNTTHLVENAWENVVQLLIPLAEHDRTIGYLSVENPENPSASVGEVVENLELIANLAVIAIEKINLADELRGKNETLDSYTSKLSSLNKMKANFIATVSHEFRTPLTSIKAYCETLLRSADEVDRNILKEFLFVINDESNRLVSLIEDILDFSQMESGMIRFERTPCSLNETIEVATKELEKNFKQKNITLYKDLPESDVTVRGERELMRQLIINLLHNASKFTPEGGNVWIRLRDETVSARIIVEDDGGGIPEDQIDKIFERFHQGDGSTTRRHGGSGLGLAICKNIVDWHDGRIWVENLRNKGAMFTAVLPKKHVVVRTQIMQQAETAQKFELERYKELLVEIVAELLGARRVSIMLLDPEQDDLRIECAIGIDEEVVEHAKLKIGEGIAGKVVQEGVTYLVEDIEDDPRTNRKNNDFLYDTRSFISVPIRRDGRVIGVVNVTNSMLKDKFDDESRMLLELFAERIGVALSKLDHFAQSLMSFSQVRNTFRAILDAKRFVDDQGADNIVTLVMQVAKKLNLNEEEQSALRYTLSVYDLGLSMVGYHVIKKPAELTVEDRKAIEKHTTLGSNMLQAIEIVPKIREAVLYHHENYDGSGYPGKLAGEEIPIQARIIRIADSIRALISHRPYQKQYTIEEATEVLKHRSGSFFDPKIVAVFLDVLEENPELLPKQGSQYIKSPVTKNAKNLEGTHCVDR